MVTLSVVISAYNEEKKIEKCLQSVQWADEIIVVDNMSTDKTTVIVKKYTSHVFTRPNNPMLNVNKNFGFTKATGDWILNLDADEQVTPELATAIQAIIKNDNGVVGYWIPRKNIIFGKWIEHGGWYPDYQMRLFRKGKGKFPEVQVHEMITVEGQTEKLTDSMIHHNFETITQFLYKHMQLYAPNEAEVMVKNGYKASYHDAIRFPLSEFLSRFFAREGYKDEFHGLMLSMLLAFYHFVIFARIWEIQGFESYKMPDTLGMIETEISKARKEIVYWVANEKIKHSKNIAKKYLLRLKRKLKA